MSISTSTNRFPYVANGATTNFAFPALFYNNSEIKVYINSALQVGGYTVTGAGTSNAGNVNIPGPLANGTQVLLTRIVPYTRLSNYVDGSDFPANTINLDLDELTMQTQQLAQDVSYSFKFPITYNGVVPTLPSVSPVANYYLRVNAAGTGFEYADVAAAGNIGLPVSISNGGTGAITALAARTALGVLPGTDVLAYVAPGTSGNVLTSNGTAWGSAAPVSKRNRIANITIAPGTTNVDINNLVAGYNYDLEFANVYGSISSDIWLRTSTDNGATFAAGGTDYSQGYMAGSNATVSSTGGLNSIIQLTAAGYGTSVGLGAYGLFHIVNPMNASFYTGVTGNGRLQNASSYVTFTSGGTRTAPEANNAIRLLPSNGTFTGGVIQVWENRP